MFNTQAFIFISLGVELAAAIVTPLYIGYRIDSHYHSSPWGICLALFIGISAGILLLMRTKKLFDKDEDIH